MSHRKSRHTIFNKVFAKYCKCVASLKIFLTLTFKVIGRSRKRLRASLVVQLIKNLPATRETWVRSLGWEDPLEEGMATHSSSLAWRIPGTCIVHGVTKSRTRLSNFPFHFNTLSLQSQKWGMNMKNCSLLIIHLKMP